MERLKPPPFTCVVCQRVEEARWSHGPRDWPIPPVCLSCEHTWGNYGWNGRPRIPSGTSIKVGAFRDRRMARVLWLLADEIQGAANGIIYREKRDARSGL